MDLLQKIALTSIILGAMSVFNAGAIDHQGITVESVGAGNFPLIVNGRPTAIMISENDERGISIAATNLAKDFEHVSGTAAPVINALSGARTIIIAGTEKNELIKQLIKQKKINGKELKGKCEKYIMTTLKSPFPGVDEALVIAGSDRRGVIYGIYELSEQIGVSPWYWWADVPIMHKDNLSMAYGTYTAGEPSVRYRGIFLNDEAPCLTDWVKNTYGTNYGDHNFYGDVCELILRLRGNYLWPAMWCWSFYGDDAENSKTADEMGVIMGTSHHEPMARNHQEWARNRKEYGQWNYAANQQVIDKFFTEGIERMKDTEDIVTIGMRGDGDAAMSETADVELLDRVIKNQRKIIEKVTNRPAKETPQIWALYKEVLDYYDKGLRAPDDVIYLLCDDNWGNVRRLPNDEERKHPGGWGLYYHVDYVGAPRNTKLLNVTPIQNMWEQLNLTYDYGVDKLWILNVGDLKPMEYPISLFFDIAWTPKKYDVNHITDHTVAFCNQQFGNDQGEEAARILNLYSKYAGRVTPEMLDWNTYNIDNGEWDMVAKDFMSLEAEALRQYFTLAPEYQDAYQQIILFPVQMMANLYDMYHSVAMNHKLYKGNNPMANEWADRAEKAFARDAELMASYNTDFSGGKWNGMMTQKHIGYKIWNDDFEKDTMPEVFRFDNPEEMKGNYVFFPGNTGVVVMEAEHYYNAEDGTSTRWTVIPDMGRTLSGIALMPYTHTCGGESLTYRMKLPEDVKNADIHIIVKSTLAFKRPEGHRYAVSIDGGAEKIVNFNSDLNENPKNIYSVFYPTVARRVVEKTVNLDIPKKEDGLHDLKIRPLDEGIVFEKIAIDYGGYEPSYLFMRETKCQRQIK